MATEFFMPMKNVPTITHQQKKVHVVNGKPIFYEPAELKSARNKLMGYVGQHVPDKKYEGDYLALLTKSERGNKKHEIEQ